VVTCAIRGRVKTAALLALMQGRRPGRSRDGNGCGCRVGAARTLERNAPRSPRPHLSLRVTTTKGKRARRVPLWWDFGRLADVAAWQTTRRDQGGRGAPS